MLELFPIVAVGTKVWNSKTDLRSILPLVASLRYRAQGVVLELPLEAQGDWE